MEYESLFYALTLLVLGALLVGFLPLSLISLGERVRARRPSRIKAPAAPPARSQTTVPWLVALRGKG